MKNLVAVALVGMIAAGSAQAMSQSRHLSDGHARAVHALLPNADLSKVTSSQAARIGLLMQEKRISNTADRRAILRNILRN